MDAVNRATLDDHILNSNLKKDFNRSYIKRSVERHPRTTISDVVISHDLSYSLKRRSYAPNRPSIVLKRVALQSKKASVQKRLNSSIHRINPVPTLPKQSGGIKSSRSGLARPKHKIHLFFKRRQKLQLALAILSVGIIMFGVYFSYEGFVNNHIVQIQAARLTAEANQLAASTKDAPAAAAAPTTTTQPAAPVLSTVKITSHVISEYTVAPSFPRYIIIPKLGVDARVISVGVDASGALKTPSNVYDTAWYNQSSEPGQPGAMLIDGHVSSWTTDGVFYGIKKLKAGDIIKIERGDGKMFTYNVVKSQVFPSGNVNMTSAMTPVVPGQPGLNLITCTGDVIPGTSTFNERIIVYATLAGS